LREWNYDQKIGQNERKTRKRLKQQFHGKLIEHEHYIGRYGEDLPKVCHWTRGATNASKPA
jgi:phosphoketolase